MSFHHTNDPNQYYQNFNPDQAGETYVEITPEDNVPFYQKIIADSSNALIELDIWKLAAIKGRRIGNNIVIDEEFWGKYTIDVSEEYSILSTENKVMVMNLLMSLREKMLEFNNILPANILVIGILQKVHFGIIDYNVVRFLIKDNNLNTHEMTIIEKNHKIQDIIYNKVVDITSTELTDHSSVIPVRPIYGLDYNLGDGELGLVLSSPSAIDIYHRTEIIGNMIIKPSVQFALIYTKVEVPIEIYMYSYDSKYELVANGISNKKIDLRVVPIDKYIKKNIVIKILDFDNNNEIYLGQILY